MNMGKSAWWWQWFRNSVKYLSLLLFFIHESVYREATRNYKLIDNYKINDLFLCIISTNIGTWRIEISRFNLKESHRRHFCDV